jgi:hypothetical protein
MTGTRTEQHAMRKIDCHDTPASGDELSDMITRPTTSIEYGPFSRRAKCSPPSRSLSGVDDARALHNAHSCRVRERSRFTTEPTPPFPILTPSRST